MQQSIGTFGFSASGKPQDSHGANLQDSFANCRNRTLCQKKTNDTMKLFIIILQILASTYSCVRKMDQKERLRLTITDVTINRVTKRVSDRGLTVTFPATTSLVAKTEKSGCPLSSSRCKQKRVFGRRYHAVSVVQICAVGHGPEDAGDPHLWEK